MIILVPVYFIFIQVKSNKIMQRKVEIYSPVGFKINTSYRDA
jgi:hypothetical protein